MKRAISTRRFGILLAIGVPLLSTVAFGQTAMFSVKALPILPGYTQAVAIGINNAGDVVGIVSPSVVLQPQYAVIWQNGMPTLLGAVAGATQSSARSINNAGQVVGNLQTSIGNQAVIWNNGIPTLLPPPPSLPLPSPQYKQTFASSLNDAGQVSGYSVSNTGSELALVWNGVTPTELGRDGNQYGVATGINLNGLVVGKIYDAAVVWHGTTPTALPKFSVPNAGGEALAVNNSGIVVGDAVTPASMPKTHAVAWANGVITDLGSLTAEKSFANAVNNRGIIVGQSNLDDGGGNGHAVIWSRIGAPIQDLDSLISAEAASEVHLTGAYSINDNCTIVVGGYTKKTKTAEALLLILNDPSKCVNGL